MSCEDEYALGSVYVDASFDVTVMPIFGIAGEKIGLVQGVYGLAPSLIPLGPYSNMTFTEGARNGTAFFGAPLLFYEPTSRCGSQVLGEAYLDLPPAHDFLEAPAHVDITPYGEGVWWTPDPNLHRWAAFPMVEDEEAFAPLNYTKAGCVPSMGQHYLRGIGKNASCDTVYPFFLVYNRGYLSAVGLLLLPDDQPDVDSPRMEISQGRVNLPQLPNNPLVYPIMTFDKAMTCLQDVDTYWLMHMWLNHDFFADTCVLEDTDDDYKTDDAALSIGDDGADDFYSF